jgi:hypothetical protein
MQQELTTFGDSSVVSSAILSEPVYVDTSTGEIRSAGEFGAAAQRVQVARLEQRARAVLAATRLDGVIPNAKLGRACEGAVRAQVFEATRWLQRTSLFGQVEKLPLFVVSRSWFTAAGRDRNRRKLMARAFRVSEARSSSGEYPKLLTLTFRDAGESWSQRDAIRRFMNNLRVWARGVGAEVKVTYLWTAELQPGRFALHYHVVLLGCPFLRREQLAHWWTFGYFDVRVADTGSALRYVLKYVQKMVGSTGQDAEIRHVLHSAQQLRRYGSSRDVSKQLEKVPAWLVELAESEGVGVGQLTWWVDEATQRGYVVLPDGEGLIIALAGLKWTLAGGWYDGGNQFKELGGPGE